jgi:hypothetical protein
MIIITREPARGLSPRKLQKIIGFKNEVYYYSPVEAAENCRRVVLTPVSSY